MQAKAGFEPHSEKSTLLFSRMGCPSSFGPGSLHLSFNITRVSQRPPGRRLPPSGLSSHTVSKSECYERSNSFVSLRHRGHFLGRDSVHLVLFGHFNRCICRTRRTVLSQMQVWIQHQQCRKRIRCVWPQVDHPVRSPTKGRETADPRPTCPRRP